MKIEISQDHIISDAQKIISSEWDGVILKMTHNAFMKWSIRVDRPIDTAGVYILYANHFDKNLGKSLYIGQSDDVIRRISQHVSAKDYWSSVIIFVSQADWMNIAHVLHIEKTFIEWAKSAHRYKIENRTEGGFCKLGDEDKLRVANYIKPVKLILELAGVDIFEKNYDNIFILEGHCKDRSYIQIVAPITSGKRVRVLSGSIIQDNSLPNATVLGLNGVTYESTTGLYTFHEDIEIDTTVPSSPVHRLLNHSLSFWKDARGLTLSKALNI